ncbi:dermonecrotic toxin domain-containing protein [Pseudomonas capeferrum]|uniref:dermonecrotic toxin domain-containing protein n=1 Tax=Pseudomonas capeferrum TaxID=1495066 RepID=UPI0015E2FBAF|nr:DUF6543 domain-containing protein [Pseudomonas capeferrum]
MTLPAPNPHLIREALKDFPRPDTQAQALLEDWLRQRNVTLNPRDIDVVTLHYQSEVLGEGRSHYRENAVVTQKMNLVEALLGNWQGEPASGYGGFHFGDWAGLAPTQAVRLVNRLEPADASSNASPYLTFNGLYRRVQPVEYGPATRLDIRAEEFQGFIWGLHFHHQFKQALDTYWQNGLAQYQRALKIGFIAACNKQVREGSLSDQGRRIAWLAAGLIPDGERWVKASSLNVYGYTTTSILCLKRVGSDYLLLYIPGNASPIHEFANESDMKHWFAVQCQDPARRDALLQHFTPGDRPDGLDYSGARTALTGLGLFPKPHRFSVQHEGFATSGVWDPKFIVNYKADEYSPAITDDLFEYLALRHKQRSYEDADGQIVTNHHIDKLKWSSYLTVATGILLPLVVAVPELTPLLVIGGLAQFSLGLDQAINGRSLEEKAQSLEMQTFGLLNAIPVAGTAARESFSVFCYRKPGFFTPLKLREFLEGPSAGTVPITDIELLPAQAAFRDDQQLSSDLTSLVVRIDENLLHRFAAWFTDEAGLVSEWVEYEMGSDSFIKLKDVKLEDPTRWIVNPGNTTSLTRLEDSTRTVTDEQRMATLRAIGIQVELPIDFAFYSALARTPIPRIISNLWVGNLNIDEEFLEALEHNARALEQTDYQYQLFLSRQDPSVYQRNLSVLRARAPRLTVLPLEDEAFYQDFAQSPYFAQYQAALVGDGGRGTHFASASDILRYRLLNHFGGLYLDADDRLLLSTSPGSSVPPLARRELSTTADGLVLAPPVSNDQMGMYIKFNSSSIGSHPDNPTLDAISEEIRNRYRLDPGFYAARDDLDGNPVKHDAYARRLNQLTGPGMLNDVIDRRLPWLRQLREVCNLLVCPLHDVHSVINLRMFIQTLREHVPLDQVAKMGQAHSWLRN